MLALGSTYIHQDVLPILSLNKTCAFFIAIYNLIISLTCKERTAHSAHIHNLMTAELNTTVATVLQDVPTGS
jgi:hypothetical protein